MILRMPELIRRDTDLRQFAEHGKALYFVRAFRPTARPCAVGYAPHRCPSGPRLDPEMEQPSTAMNLTVMSRAPLGPCGFAWGEHAVPHLAQQREDQYIPSESLVMTAVEDKSPLVNR